MRGWPDVVEQPQQPELVLAIDDDEGVAPVP